MVLWDNNKCFDWLFRITLFSAFCFPLVAGNHVWRGSLLPWLREAMMSLKKKKYFSNSVGWEFLIFSNVWKLVQNAEKHYLFYQKGEKFNKRCRRGDTIQGIRGILLTQDIWTIWKPFNICEIGDCENYLTCPCDEGDLNTSQ